MTHDVMMSSEWRMSIRTFTYLKYSTMWVLIRHYVICH